ncbi:MAG TPA: two-component regulator propeller domain-containing protein [Prolixibacteraceae bacterium]|nr:two-component regulator propeller domain-containing protein [Prolixibacteraceae bacterium]
MKILNPKNLLILICLLNSLFASGDIPSGVRFETLNADKGLSQNTITDIVQDNDGFIWIACENGLNQWDGFSVKQYSPVTTNSGFVLQTMLLGLKLFDDGILWLDYQDRNPHVCYHKSFGFKTWYEFFLNIDHCDSLHLVNLLRGTDNRYWALIKNQNDSTLKVGYFEGGKFHFQQSYKGTTSGRTPLFEDSQHNLWFSVSQSKTLGCINMDTFHTDTLTIRYTHFIRPVETGFYSVWDSTLYFTDFENRETRAVFRSEVGVISTFFAWGDELIFVENNGTIVYLSPTTKNTVDIHRKYLTDNRLVEELDYDRQGNVWMSVPGYGVVVYRKNENRFLCIPSDKESPHTPSHYSIARTFADREGNIFMGSMYDGVYIFFSDKNEFSFNHKINSCLNKFSTASIAVDFKNHVWVSNGSGGLMECYENGRYSMHLENRDIGFGDLLFDDDSLLWLGSKDHGVFRYNIHTRELKSLAEIAGFSFSKWSQRHICHMSKDSNNNLWIGTWDGIFKLHPNRKTLQHFPFDFPLGDPRNGLKNVFTILETKQNTFLTGTEYGVAEIDKKGTVLRIFAPDPSNPNALNHPTVFTLYTDSKNRTWAGTYGGGMNQIDTQTGLCKHYTKDNGLCDNMIGAILEDCLGNLWIATGNGLSCFDPETDQFFNYHTDDGLPFNGFNQNSLIKIDEHTFLACGEKGLVTFDPTQISTRKPKDRELVITGFEVYNSGKDLSWFLKNEGSIELNHKENVFKINYVTPTFDIPQKISFEYRIEDLHEQWIDNGKNQSLIFTNLPAGKHRLLIRVKAINNHENPLKAIPITIYPPFYRTLWFKMLLVLSALFLIVFFFITRIRRLKYLEKMRMQIASDLHDEIGSSLSTIGFIGYQISNESMGRDKLDKLGKDLNRISQSTAESIRDIIWFINPSNDPFPKLVAHMEAVAGQILYRTKFTFEVDKDAIPNEADGRTKRNIYLIFKEVINNIAKHAQATEVKIQIFFEPGMLRLQIADNGIGFDVKNPSNGMGMKSIRNRAEEIGGILHIESTAQQGTTIMLTTNLWKK